jgi:hypothetical protein
MRIRGMIRSLYEIVKIVSGSVWCSLSVTGDPYRSAGAVQQLANRGILPDPPPAVHAPGIYLVDTVKVELLMCLILKLKLCIQVHKIAKIRHIRIH